MPHRTADLLARVRELRLPKDERRAARDERAAERQLRRERDNKETAARRAAAVDAEKYSRHSGGFSQHWKG
jgi:hypothetical protein